MNKVSIVLYRYTVFTSTPAKSRVLAAAGR